MDSLGGSPEAAPRIDRDTRVWLQRLRGHGHDREAAVAELHVMLVRAARFEVRRRRPSGVTGRSSDHEDIAHQSADDALVAILRKLDDFRGESRFTTWATKFALYEAAAQLRRRAWQEREIPLADAGWARLADLRDGPHADLVTRDRLAAVQDAIVNDLTAYQRDVLIALAINDVPIDVLAQRHATTRGALYKALHDSRRKLRAGLAARGMSLDGADEEPTP
ncbi:MAG: RNA polymerase sigma factor [Solirubrobacteraceae bacterium]